MPAGGSTARWMETGRNWTEDEPATLLFLLVLVIWQTPQNNVALLSFFLKVSDYLLVNFCLCGICQVSFAGLWVHPNV